VNTISKLGYFIAVKLDQSFSFYHAIVLIASESYATFAPSARAIAAEWLRKA